MILIVRKVIPIYFSKQPILFQNYAVWNLNCSIFFNINLTLKWQRNPIKVGKKKNCFIDKITRLIALLWPVNGSSPKIILDRLNLTFTPVFL